MKTPHHPPRATAARTRASHRSVATPRTQIFGAVLGLSLLSALASGHPRAAAATPPCADALGPRAIGECLDEALRTHLDGALLSGVLLVAGPNDEFERSYGRRSEAEPSPASVDDLFRVASVSKPIAAAVALRLAQDGALDLDAPVQASFPELESELADADPQPRLRDLLTHTAGFRGAGDKISLTDFSHVRYVGGDEGREPHYENLNYLLLGEAIERQTGRDFEALSADVLADPALSFGAPVEAPKVRGRAAGWFRTWDASTLLDEEQVAEVESEGGAAAGLRASPKALAGFMRHLFAGDFLDAPHRKALQETRVGPQGLGWAVAERESGELVHWHNGALTPYGWNAFAAWVPSRDCAVVFLGNMDIASGATDELLFDALLRSEFSAPAGDSFGRTMITLLGWRWVFWVFPAVIFAWALWKKRRAGQRDAASARRRSS